MAVPERKDVPVEYTWKLEDIYASNEAWEADFEKAGAMVKVISSFAGKLGEPQVLKQALNAYFSLNQTVDSLFTYARMRRDEDNRRTEYQALTDRAQSLAVSMSTACAYIEPELLELDAAYLKEVMDTEGFENYKVFLSEIERRRPHTLTAAEERIIAMTGEMGSSPDTVYSMLTDADMKFPVIKGENGEKTELTHGNYIPLMMSTDRKVRKAAYTALYNTYKKYSSSIPAIYASSVKCDLFYASCAKHGSALEAALFPDAVPQSVYDNLIASMHKHLPALNKYIRRNAKLIGVKKPQMWDLYVSAVDGFDIKLPFDEAYQLMMDCLYPLGEDYREVLKKAKDERWIDAFENVGKSSGAYSWGTYASHPFVLMSYNPSLDSLLTVAHEMGHSMHTYYSSHTQPYPTADYSLFVAEVASTTNEVLVLSELLERYKDDKKAQAYIIGYILEGFRTTVFRQTMFAEFEKEAHAMAERGESLTVESLNKLYGGLNDTYYPAVAHSDLIAYEWMRIPHFYRAFYVYKYATGYCAAFALANMIRTGGPEAVARYKKFLSLGSSMHPIDLLKVAGVDMESPAAVDASLKKFDELVEKYLELTKEEV